MRAASIATATRVAAAGNGVGIKQPVAYSILSEQILTAASQLTKESGGSAVITTSSTAPTPAGQTSYVHVTNNGYSGSSYGFNFAGSWDFTDCFFRFMVRCQLYGYTQGYFIRFATSLAAFQAGNYLNMRIAPGNAAPNWLVPGTWVWDGFDPLLMTAVGSGASLSSIGYIGFASQDVNNSQTCDWDFGRIQRVQKVGTKAKCVIWHDDSVASGYTAIKTKLDAYGWAGTEANEWGAMDTGPTFLGAADLVTAKAAGWHIATHAFTPPEHTAVTEAQFANQMLRAKTFSAKYGLSADAVDFAYWGGLGSDIAYRQLQRLCRTGRFYTAQLQQPETQPPCDPHLMKAFGADSGQTFATHWKPILQNAITSKGLAQLVFHQQIGSDSSQASEFDAMLTWLDQNRASIDVVSFGVAIAPMLVGYVPGVVTAPTAMSLSAVAGNAQVTISRTGGAGSGVSYKLYRGTSATGTPIATSLPFTDTGLTNGTAVSYIATATNSGGTVTSNVISSTPVNPHDPTLISGLIARYRASDITGVTSGSPFAVWPDTSGSGYDATALDSNARPLWVSNVINGKPVVRFAATSGTAYAGKMLASDLPAGPAAQTFVAIIQTAADGLTKTLRAGAANNGLTYRINGNKLEMVKRGIAVLATDTPTVPTAPAVVAFQYDNSNATYKFVTNGTPGASAVKSINPVAGKSTIGGDAGFNAEPFVGDIAEILVFNKSVSTSELAIIDSYAKDYYAIAVSDYA